MNNFAFEYFTLYNFFMKKQDIEPFVKWVGGKRQLLKEIEKRLPKSFNTYHEPFVGGGALLFYLQPEKAIISDLNSELITTYKTIKKSYRQLREYLLLMEYGHSEAFFKQIRNIDKNDKNNLRALSLGDSDLLKAARFIYLNKAGFNGLYRVNGDGYFNVPSGKKEKVKTHEFPNLKLVSDYLSQNKVSIYNRGYEAVVRVAKSGDFVYLDPPYDYEPSQKGFDSYQKESFGVKGQKQLAEVCRKLDANGVKFMLSNHNTKLIRELYRDFKIDVINAKRLVGGKGATREDVEEVLITNYEK